MAGGFRRRAVTYAWVLVIVVLAVADLRVWLGGIEHGIVWPRVSMDLDLYVAATRRWLDGGSFYHAYQLAGPFHVEGWPDGQQPVLYPPPAALLFLPFLYRWAIFWWVIPLAIVWWCLWTYRPSGRGWLVIALLALWPPSVYAIIAGNPGMWVMAAVALATRWPAFGPWVLLKPTLLPFALIGIRQWRRWLPGAVTLALVSAALLPMWDDYLTVLGNARSGLGFLYSLPQAGFVLIPVAAWVARQSSRATRARTRADLTLTSPRAASRTG